MIENEEEVTKRMLEIIHGVSKHKEKKVKPEWLGAQESEITRTTIETIELRTEKIKNDPDYTDEEKKEYTKTLNNKKPKQKS